MSRRSLELFNEHFKEKYEIKPDMFGFLLASSFTDPDKRTIFLGLTYDNVHGLLIGDEINGMIFIAADIFLQPSEEEPMILLLQRDYFLDWKNSSWKLFDTTSCHDKWCYSTLSNFTANENYSIDVIQHTANQIEMVELAKHLFEIFNGNISYRDMILNRQVSLTENETFETDVTESHNHGWSRYSN